MRIPGLIMILVLLPMLSRAQKDSSSVLIEIGYRLNREQISKDSHIELPKSISGEKAHVYAHELGHELYTRLNLPMERWRLSLLIGCSVWSESLVGEFRRDLPYNSGGTTVAYYEDLIVRYAGRSVYLKGGLAVGYNVLPSHSRFELIPTLGFNPEFRVYQSNDTTSVVTHQVRLMQSSSSYTLYESTIISDELSPDLYFDVPSRSKIFSILAPSLSLRSGFGFKKGIYLMIEGGYRWGGSARLSFMDYRQSSDSWFASGSIAFKI